MRYFNRHAVMNRSVNRSVSPAVVLILISAGCYTGIMPKRPNMAFCHVPELEATIYRHGIANINIGDPIFNDSGTIDSQREYAIPGPLPDAIQCCQAAIMSLSYSPNPAGEPPFVIYQTLAIRGPQKDGCGISYKITGNGLWHACVVKPGEEWNFFAGFEDHYPVSPDWHPSPDAKTLAEDCK